MIDQQLPGQRTGLSSSSSLTIAYCGRLGNAMILGAGLVIGMGEQQAVKGCLALNMRSSAVCVEPG